MSVCERILVVANRTCPCPALHDHVHGRLTERPAEVLVVAPALNSRLKHWLSDSDGAAAQAHERLDLALDGMRTDGVAVRGVVGDAEPLHAIEDVLEEFQADEVIISTHPPGDSHWLETGLLERARERLDVPVTHFTSEYGAGEPEA